MIPFGLIQSDIPLIGIVIPAIVLLISFLLTFGLYRHFARKTEDREN